MESRSGDLRERPGFTILVTLSSETRGDLILCLVHSDTTMTTLRTFEPPAKPLVCQLLLYQTSAIAYSFDNQNSEAISYKDNWTFVHLVIQHFSHSSIVPGIPPSDLFEQRSKEIVPQHPNFL